MNQDIPTPHTPVAPTGFSPRRAFSVFAWPAWLRLLAVLPLIALLWLGVAWALAEVAP